MFGQVIPKHADLTILPFRNISFDLTEHDLRFSFSASIVHSEIKVEVDINRLGPNENMHAHSLILDFLQSAVNLVCFERGTLLLPVIEGVELPDGKIQPLLVFLPALAPLCTAFTNADAPFRETSTSPLRWVMRDLISALQPDMVTIGCARAIDGIRNLTSSTAETDRQAWAEMRQKLRMDEAFLRFISNSSRNHRHAKREPMGAETTVEVLTRSWTVMDRYLHFMKRGGVNSLPEDEFPLLKG
jgi:hypothetical protein